MSSMTSDGQSAQDSTLPLTGNPILDRAVRVLATPQLLENWLSTFPPDDIAGRSRLPTVCPLSTFLFDATKARFACSIESIALVPVLADRQFAPPRWVRLFLCWVDGLAAGGECITYAQCLAVLWRVQEAMERQGHR
jgi:hypothetical protein